MLWFDYVIEKVAAVGEDILSLLYVCSERFWNAIASFYEQVMLIKQAAKRERECLNLLPNLRPGRRRKCDYL